MSTPTPSRNDPTPHRRRGDSSFLPVVIMAAIFLLIAFIAALILMRTRQNKIVPAPHQPTSTSQITAARALGDYA